jgi:hypothetical protein
MPLNSQGTIQVFTAVAALAAYGYAPQDTGVFLSAIPSGGIVLTLPDDPNDGDWYEFADVDGSCGPGNPIVVTAGADTTIQGGAALTIINPYSAGVVRYSAGVSNWVFVSRTSASSTDQQTLYGASTGQSITTSFAPVAGCSLSVDVTSTQSKILFWAALSAIGGSEAAGILSWRVVVDPTGADTVVGFNASTFGADQAGVNGGAVAGEITGLAAGTHVIRIEADASVTGLTIGTIGAGQPNANLLLQVIG